MTPDRYLGAPRQLVSCILSSIPTHEEEPRSVIQIAARVAPSFEDLPIEHLEATTTTILVVLNVFGVLSANGGRYRCRSQIPVYFLDSLAWYVAHARRLVNNWSRPGVGADISVDALLDAAPYLLKLMEDKRLRLAGPGLEPARTRRVACVLIKTVVDGSTRILFEWDRVAAQYQLIGGLIHADEEPRSAAVQEVIEELVIEPGYRLEHGRHFDVRPLDWNVPPPLVWTAVSRTVGALTRYEAWAYGGHMKIGRLNLGERYRWLTIAEMLAGRTASGRPTSDSSLFQLIDDGLAGGLEGIPTSIPGDAVSSLGDAFDSRTAERARIFVGHGRGAAWRELAEHLRDRHGYHVVTYESERRPGVVATEVLTRLVEQASFAILVHTAEDEQADGGLRARQNVVHETGLFQGKLGFPRAIIVRQRGCDPFSNVAGLHEVHYTTEISEAFGEVLAALRRELG